jgi:cell wall-associated NlpC family hydrolase
MTTRAEVIEAARSLLGTPYVHQARYPGLAIDCLGVPIVVARQCNMVAQTFDINGYSKFPDGTMVAQADTYMTRITQDEMREADCVVVMFDSDPQHFGILVPYRHGGLAMVHASSTHKKVIETRLLFGKDVRAMKFVAAYRLPGITD